MTLSEVKRLTQETFNAWFEGLEEAALELSGEVKFKLTVDTDELHVLMSQRTEEVFTEDDVFVMRVHLPQKG
jgi:hypothetical protein